MLVLAGYYLCLDMMCGIDTIHGITSIVRTAGRKDRSAGKELAMRWSGLELRGSFGWTYVCDFVVQQARCELA